MTGGQSEYQHHWIHWLQVALGGTIVGPPRLLLLVRGDADHELRESSGHMALVPLCNLFTRPIMNLTMRVNTINPPGP